MAGKIGFQKVSDFSGLKTYQLKVLPQIEAFLDEFFAGEIDKAKKISPLAVRSLRFYREYLHGGKKMRGVLTCLGYEAAGGKNFRKVAVPAAAAMEIFHHFLIIHDDWIDQDEVRHGKPTIHKQYENYFEKQDWSGDKAHWAAGMAVVLGDAGHAWSYGLVSSLPCAAERRVAALKMISEFGLKTVYGQFLDITQDLMPKVAYREILKTRELKTAFYTLVMPLTLGAILGGGERKTLESISEYGLPVGIAFQLRDDELGVFGDEKIMGKSACQDLVTGKKTLLLAKAVEKMTGSQRKKYGDYCRRGEVEAARKMVRESGALEYSQTTMGLLVEKGKRAIPGITKNRRLQTILGELADYVVSREK